MINLVTWNIQSSDKADENNDKNKDVKSTISQTESSTSSSGATAKSSRSTIVYEDKEDSKPKIEHTLALIKPEALKYQEEIKASIQEAGFTICQSKLVHLTPEQASHFYLDAYDNELFFKLVEHMSSAPILAMILSKFNAITDWKLFMGPRSVRYI